MTLPSMVSQALGSVVTGKFSLSQGTQSVLDDMLIPDSSLDSTLHSVSNFRKYTECNWCRSYVYISSMDWRLALDKLSDPDVHWSWVCVANGV